MAVKSISNNWYLDIAYLATEKLAMANFYS